ncbi:MAG TPA: M20 family metallopeptidase [Solirubrobacteraceae bacterium]|jgi:glutamate carboxypeptidase
MNPDIDRALGLLERLVNIETPSGHAPGILRAFDLLRDRLAPLLGSDGIVVQGDGAPHLLWDAADEPRVLLLGHADTVWPLGTLAGRPFACEGARATGPGVFDMKSGLVVAAEALALAQDVSHVAVLVTGDEELGSPSSRDLIERVAGRCRSVLVLEPSIDGALKTARKGAALYRVQITGRGAHAGLEPEHGVNALTELAAVIRWTEALASEQAGTTVTPTVARAGEAINSVPAAAELHLDVRAWSAEELDRVDRGLARLTPRDADASLRITGGINRYPMEPAQSRELVLAARMVAAIAGLPPIEETRVGGGSDGNFTAALGVPTLDGLGASGGGAHTEEEWIAVDSLAPRARLVAGLLDTLR